MRKGKDRRGDTEVTRGREGNGRRVERGMGSGDREGEMRKERRVEGEY